MASFQGLSLYSIAPAKDAQLSLNTQEVMFEPAVLIVTAPPGPVVQLLCSNVQLNISKFLSPPT